MGSSVATVGSSSTGASPLAGPASTPEAGAAPSVISVPSARTAPAGQAWYQPPDGGAQRKLAIPPVTQLVSGYPYEVVLTTGGEVWTIDPRDGTVAKLDLSGVRQLSDHQDTGNPDPWYGLRGNGTVVVGSGNAHHPYTEVALPFKDVVEIAASDGLWVLRSDGTVWSVDVDFETVSDAGSPVPTGYSGETYDIPKGVTDAPVQGLTKVTHLWNGVGTHPPVAESADGALRALEHRDSSGQPAALPVSAPRGRVAQMGDAGGTWVAIDAAGELWYWPGGTEQNSDSDRYKMLRDDPPQPLVGPDASKGLVILGGGAVYSADGTVWQLTAGDSGVVTVQQVPADRMATIRIPVRDGMLAALGSVVIAR